MQETFITLVLGQAPPPLAVGLELTTVIGSAAGIAVAFLVFAVLVKNLLYICRPNEVLIFTGRRRVENGVELGPMIITPRGSGDGDPVNSGGGRGRAWRIPIIERVDRMDTTTISTDIVVQNAYSAGNIPLRIHAIANVKLHTDPTLIRNAIERFLGQSREEVQLVAQQTLEGALREVLALLTPEEVNEDRLKFAENLLTAAQDDLEKLGLALDTLKIQSVSDETGYLDSLGRPRIARALRDAENAENQAQQEVVQSQADAHRRAEGAKADAETMILRTRNDYTRVKAELSGSARAIEEEAEAAAKTARATAERTLQTVRKELEIKRLQAEVVIPAEAQRQAKMIKAKGDAAPTIENGAAVVEVLRETTDAWTEMGDSAKEIWVIQHLEEIVKTVVDSMKNIEVQEVSVLDPGDGSGLSAYAAAYPNTVAAILRSLKETTGIDVPSILNGRDEPAISAPPRPRPPTLPSSLGRSSQ